MIILGEIYKEYVLAGSPGISKDPAIDDVCANGNYDGDIWDDDGTDDENSWRM